ANPKRGERKPQRRIHRVAVRNHQDGRQNRRRRECREQISLRRRLPSIELIDEPIGPADRQEQPDEFWHPQRSRPHPIHGARNERERRYLLPITLDPIQEHVPKMLTHCSPIWHPKARTERHSVRRHRPAKDNDQIPMTNYLSVLVIGIWSLVMDSFPP